MFFDPSTYLWSFFVFEGGPFCGIFTIDTQEKTKMIMDLDANRLILSTLYNARDLGGLRTAFGKRTAFRRFVRSDEPSLLSEEDLEALLLYPIRTVIDLRSQEEINRRGTPFMNHPDILFRNISLFESDPEGEDDPTVQVALRHTLGELYIFLLETRKIQLSEVFRQILDAPEGAILFHCTHGKDRTGIIAALLLSLVQVSREDIVNNYSVTYDYIRALVDPKLALMPIQTHHIFKSDAENMEIFLDFLDKKYQGQAAVYLRSIGFSELEISKLRSRLLES